MEEWERSRTLEKAAGGSGRQKKGSKRGTKEQGRRSKKFKHEVLLNWGEEQGPGGRSRKAPGS